MTMTDQIPRALAAIAALETKVTQQAQALAQQHARIDELTAQVAQLAAQLEATLAATMVRRPTNDN